MKRVIVAVVVVGAVSIVAPASSAAPRSAECGFIVHPGQHFVRLINRSASSRPICFARGTYFVPKPLSPSQSVIGHDTVLTGARTLHFRRHGRAWMAPAFHANGQRNGFCEPRSHGACIYPNDVLRDGRPMRRVFSRSRLGGHRYLERYGANRLVVRFDPNGHRMQIEVTPAAFVLSRDPATGSDTIKGFTIEDFASPAQHGAIDDQAKGWRIARNTVEVNHGAGISTNGHSVVSHNRLLRNGQEGIAGDGDHNVVRGNVIAHNNTEHFDPNWEAGGGKWAVSDHLRVVANTVIDNDGPGLWTDIDSLDTTYANNRVVGNTEAGIFHEISGSATIHGNTVVHNGFGKPEWLWGSGILLAASHDVSVVNNEVSHNAEGIGLVQQDRGVSSRDGTPRVLHDISISHNTVHMAGGNSGVVEDNGDEGLFGDDTIGWIANTWYGVHGKPFEWNDTEISAADWQASGHDVDGTFD